MYGDSAGHLPNQVRRRKFETKDQKTRRANGENIMPLKRSFDEEIVKANRANTDKRRPMTPPNLLGMERRIA